RRQAEEKASSPDDASDIPLKSSGFVDVDGSGVSADDLRAHACSNLLQRSSSIYEQSLIYAGRDEVPVSEYNEPRLLELAFPTLFPRGIGGYDFSALR